MVVNRFFVIITVISMISAGITFLLGWFIRNRIVTYIPAMITGVLGVTFFIKSYFFSQGFEDIGYMILAMISGVAFIASLAMAVVMSVFRKRIE